MVSKGDDEIDRSGGIDPRCEMLLTILGSRQKHGERGLWGCRCRCAMLGNSFSWTGWSVGVALES